jgi:hypothetical protein
LVVWRLISDEIEGLWVATQLRRTVGSLLFLLSISSGVLRLFKLASPFAYNIVHFQRLERLKIISIFKIFRNLLLSNGIWSIFREKGQRETSTLSLSLEKGCV